MIESRDKEVLVSGPAGTGKSRACLEKIHLAALMTSNVRILILRKTLRSLASTALVTWRKFVIKEALLTNMVYYYGGSAQEAPQYRYKNGSTVTIGGLDNPTRVMSSEYDIIYVQEATEITVEDLELCKTRLRNNELTFQQLLMDCNPDSEHHWLKQRCVNKLTTLIESRHEDNPTLFNEDGTLTDNGTSYIAILDALTGVRYQRLRRGLWVSAEGLILEEYDPAVHVLDWELDDDGNPIPLPVEWPRYWVIDFGYVHPFVLKCYAVGPDGELYMYREIHMSQRLVEDHAKTIIDIVAPEITTVWYDNMNRCERIRTERKWIEPQPVAIICDHDAEGRKTFERHTGLSTRAANKAVSVGLDLLKARFKVDANGMTRFYIMRDALVEVDSNAQANMRPLNSEQEYLAYVWKKKADGRTLDEPVKIDDDGVDCDRYIVMDLDFKGGARATIIGD